MGTPSTLTGVLRARADESGDENAFVFLDEDQRVTYAELDRRARATAASLQRRLRPGDRALLLAPPGLDYVAGFFGCLYAGVIAVPAYPPDPSRLTRTLPRLLSIASDARAAAVLTTAAMTELAEGMFALAPELAKLSWISTAAPPGLESEWRETEPRPGDAAFLQYTSGSTASPRGVVLSHANLLHNLEAIRRAFRMDRETRGVIWLPPYHDMGLIGGILAPVFAGGETALMSPLSFLQQPLRWLTAISRHRAAISGGPNFAYDLCVRKIPPDARASLDLSCWQVAFSGAEPVRAETLARFAEAFGPCGFQRRAFFPCYGLAEATLLATASERGQEPRLREVSAAALERNEIAPPAGERDRRVLVGCGASIEGQELVVVDPPSSERCPPGRVGEIWLRGPSVASAYFGDPERSVDAMRARLADGSGPYLRTGDLGFLDGAQLHVTGRLKDVLILRGRNVYPQDVEQAAEGAHPLIRPGASAAFGVEEGGEEALVVACEVDRALADVPEEALEQVARAVRHAAADVAGVAPHAVALLRRGSLPKTSSGKVQRHLCRDGFRARTLDALLIAEAPRPRPGDAPRDALEAKVAGAFAGVLGAAEVGVHDHFFELGGQSLLAAELCRRLSDELGVDVSLTALFDHPTPGLLASAIRAMDAGTGRAPAGLPPLIPAPEERLQPFPLTELQEAYWIGRSPELVLGNVATHAYAEHEVGALDLPRLEAAWRRVVARHEMLRAVVLKDGRQQILPGDRTPPYAVEVSDLRGASEEERERQLAAAREELSHQVLPADRWPLFTLRATRLPRERTRLHLGVDLLMVDLRSAEILLRELALLYESPDAPLPPLELSFRDYVLSMERAQNSPRVQRAREYWTARLADLPGGPDLPLSCSPETITRPRFARRSTRLDREAAARLQDRAARAGLTVSTTLLRAFAEVLAAWSRTPRFTISVTLFHRLPIHPQVNGVVGDFTSLTLLVVDLSSRRPFEAAARETQRQLWRDLDHQLFGGVRVIRERARTHGPASMPVAFTSAPGARGEDAAPARKLLGDPIYAVSQTSQTWLDHQARWVEGALELSWDAVEALFPPGMLDDMFAAYAALVRRLADGDEAWGQPARDLAPERQLQARRRANATAGDLKQGLLQDGFWRWVAEQPERTAVMAPNRIVSYRHLAAAASSVAARLRDRGIQRNELVAVVMDRGWEQVASVLGILGAGAAYLPVDASLPEERRAFLLERGQARIALTQPWLRKSLAFPAGAAVLPVTEGDLHAPFALPPPPCPAGPLDLAYVVFTSGSTGQPKGVMVEHRAALNTIADVNQRFRVGPEDRVLALSSLSFDLSAWDVFGVLEAGGALVVPDREQAKDARHWLDLVERGRVTVWNTVPALMELLVEQAEAQKRRLPDALRLAMLSGDWIPLALPDRLRAVSSAEVVSLGGATEASIWSVFHRVQKIDPSWRSIPYGTPLRNQTLHVLGPGLEPRPDLVPGELYIGGAGLARGYWRDEERTRERFITHPSTGERLYRTGDLARALPDGSVELLGRQDLQVKVQGHRVELGEVEAVLRQYPGVQGVVAAAVGAGQDRRLVAWVVPHSPGAAPTGDELRAFAERQLPSYMVPAAVVLMSRFPLSSNGKVDRSALPSPGVAAPASSGGPPQGRTEERIAALFRALFGRESVQRDDHFFELGGNSILASRLALRLREAFKIALPIRLVFARPTVAGLAAEVERALRGEEESRSQLDLHAEASLDPEIVPGPAAAPGRRLGAVFLTGATGFLGSHLLAELLARTDAEVVCLVRAGHDPQASARLQESLARHRVAVDHRALVTRVRALAGDLERPLFGLPEAEFRALGREMDAVVHAAASTNLLLPYEALRGTNVVGTLDCIRLACAERRKPLELVSSAAVLLARDLAPAQPLDEDGEIEDGNALVGGYAQTKWVAERLARAAAARGLEARIHRPAIITPHPVTGAAAERDAFTTLLRAMVAVGAVPDLDLELNLVPVDFVASAIVALMLRGGGPGRFHLATGVPLHLGGVRQLLQRRGWEMDLVPFREWCGRALQHARRSGDEPLQALIPGLTERLGDRTMVEALGETMAALRLSCRRTSELLAREGISARGAPELLSGYLDRLLQASGASQGHLVGRGIRP